MLVHPLELSKKNIIYTDWQHFCTNFSMGLDESFFGSGQQDSRRRGPTSIRVRHGQAGPLRGGFPPER